MQNISTLSQDSQTKIKTYNEEFTDLFELFEKVVYKSDLEFFTLLVDELEDINFQNNYGWTLLHITIRRGESEMV